MKWDDARGHCEDQGLELAAILDLNMQEDVKKYLSNAASKHAMTFFMLFMVMYLTHTVDMKPTWLDATNPDQVVCSSDMECANKLFNLAGDAIDTTGFIKKPTLSRPERCVAMKAVNGHLIDLKCDKEAQVLCQTDCGAANNVEWSQWEAWSQCSVSCDYGIRQRFRTCPVADACSGLDVDTEYCLPGNCPMRQGTGKLKQLLSCLCSCSANIYGGSLPFLVTATLAKRYTVSAAARDAFLTAATPVTPLGRGSSSLPLMCLIECLKLRSDRFDFESCNSFIIEGGRCMLGYVEPNWLMVERKTSEEGNASSEIYFDVSLD